MITSQNHRDPASAADASADASAADADSTMRLNVNLAPAVADALKAVAKRNGWTYTEAIRRAVSLLAFVDSANSRGATLNLYEDGTLKEVLFV